MKKDRTSIQSQRRSPVTGNLVVFIGSYGDITCDPSTRIRPKAYIMMPNAVMFQPSRRPIATSDINQHMAPKPHMRMVSLA